MEIKRLHTWPKTVQAAIGLQRQLAVAVQCEPIGGSVKTVCGIDCAFDLAHNLAIAAAVVLLYPQDQVIETASAACPIGFPYVPGLLSFREAPACLDAIKKLQTRPDLFIIDGQGIAHPRRLGLASHLGLWLDCPTIGCAKSRLCGTCEMPKNQKGDWTALTLDGQTIGAVVRTKVNTKPLFVSVGHRCLLEEAIDWTVRLASRFRLPEPTRQAHLAAERQKRLSAAAAQ